MMERALVIGGIWLTACGPQAAPAKTAEPVPTPSAAPAPVASAATSATPVVVAPEPVASAASTATPAAPSLHDLCLAMCDKVRAKCPKSSFEACQVNCSKYDPAPDGCDDVVRQALTCARDAADLVCANVAPESCGKRFRQITACASGKQLNFESTAAVALPPGFALYENMPEGVRAPMPEGVTAGADNVIATTKQGEGAVYSIRKLPRPEGKLNEKVFLKIAMNLFGRCSDKMKLQGMVEKRDRTSINYTTKCADGTEEQGLFWATDKALFVASVKGEPGKLGPTEAFLYGFEAK